MTAKIRGDFTRALSRLWRRYRVPFSPPPLSGSGTYAERERTRRGRLLGTLLGATLPLVGLQVLLGLTHWGGETVALSLFFCAQLACARLNHRRRTGEASWLYLAGLFGVYAALMVFLPGLLPIPGFIASTLTVLLSGFLVGRRAPFVFAATNTAVVAVHVLRHAQALSLIPGYAGQTLPALIGPPGVLLLVLAVITSLGAGSLEDALARADQADILERRVAERTADLATAHEDQRREHEFLRRVLDTDPNFIFVKDADGRFVLANAAVAGAYGTTPEGLVGKTDADFNPNADEVEQFRQSERGLLDSGHDQLRYEEGITDAQGRRRWLQMIKRPLHALGEGAPQVLGICTDITDRREAERALHESRERLHFALKGADMGTWSHDVSTGKTAMSEECRLLMGLAPDQRLDGLQALLDVIHEGDRRPLTDEIKRAEGEKCGYQCEFRVAPPGGGVRWLATMGRFTYNEETGLAERLGGAVMDITDRKALEAERERLLAQTETLLAEALERADRDPLTGLLNHRAFHRRLDEEADRARRTGQSLCVAMLDLDNFKFFNDSYGHLAGDDVMRRVAAALAGACRSYDVLARFGGDEFALLMPGVGAAEAAGITGRAQACLDELGYRPPGHDASIPLSLSVGLAVLPDDSPTRMDVLALADERLYRAKTGGGDGAGAECLRGGLMRHREGFPMLDALVAAVDNKDRYTRRHSEDVMTYCLQIADGLGLGEAPRHTLAVAALLHDVGKIGVPDAVLRKPGRLTEEETEAIKQHPLMGSAIVGAVPGFDETLDAVRHHHERWDGAGYPSGLSGEEIPLLARLMAVADAFSAMTTDRPYRKGMPKAKALAILHGGAGTQWDPRCVSAFLCAHSADVPASQDDDRTGLAHSARPG